MFTHPSLISSSNCRKQRESKLIPAENSEHARAQDDDDDDIAGLVNGTSCNPSHISNDKNIRDPSSIQNRKSRRRQRKGKDFLDQDEELVVVSVLNEMKKNSGARSNCDDDDESSDETSARQDLSVSTRATAKLFSTNRFGIVVKSKNNKKSKRAIITDGKNENLQSATRGKDCTNEEFGGDEERNDDEEDDEEEQNNVSVITAGNAAASTTSPISSQCSSIGSVERAAFERAVSSGEFYLPVESRERETTKYRRCKTNELEINDVALRQRNAGDQIDGEGKEEEEEEEEEEDDEEQMAEEGEEEYCGEMEEGQEEYDEEEDEVATSGDDDDEDSCPNNHRQCRHRLPVEDDSLPYFCCLVGVPGSGKSTWCDTFERKLKERGEKNGSSSRRSECVVIHSDAVRAELTGSINDQTQNESVWAEILLRVQNSLLAGVNTVLDATNVDTIRRRTFVNSLPPCRLRLKTFFVNEGVAKGRIAKDLKEGKDRSAVPEKILNFMMKKFKESLSTLPEEGWRPFSEEEFCSTSFS